MISFPTRHFGAFLVLTICALASGCNLSDPIEAPGNGCANDSECSDHGICNSAATCVCDDGYAGESCGECEAGYTRESSSADCVPEAANSSTTNNAATNNATTNNAATNNATTNNATTNNNTTCADDEVMIGDMCVSDSCATPRCGPGTCTVTGEGTWMCSCPDGTSGTDCPAVSGSEAACLSACDSLGSRRCLSPSEQMACRAACSTSESTVHNAFTTCAAVSLCDASCLRTLGIDPAGPTGDVTGCQSTCNSLEFFSCIDAQGLADCRALCSTATAASIETFKICGQGICDDDSCYLSLIEAN